MLRLGLRRCRRCEGPIHIKDYKPYCDRCGFQGPYDRGGTQILGRDPEQMLAIAGIKTPTTPTNPNNVSRETPPWE
jgi:hypothetical protein